MSFQIKLTRSLLDMEMAMEILDLRAPPDATAATVRALITNCVDEHFANGTELSATLYNRTALKPYWVQVDEGGMTIGPWKDIPNLETQFSYRSFHDILYGPYVPRKATGVAPNAKAKETNELRVGYRSVRGELVENYLHLEKEITDLNKEVASGNKNLSPEIVLEFNQLKAKVEELSRERADISPELRAELNALGKGIRNNVVIVHSAPYIGSPDDDAAAILSRVGDLASFGDFKAHRRGRRQGPNANPALLAIMMSSELCALKVLEKYATFRQNWLTAHKGARAPFKIEPDLPHDMVQFSSRLNQVVGYWRDKGFGDIRKHGEKIVYFDKGKRIGEICFPEGNHPWPDPVLPIAGNNGKRPRGRPSVYDNSRATLETVRARNIERPKPVRNRGKNAKAIAGLIARAGRPSASSEDYDSAVDSADPNLYTTAGSAKRVRLNYSGIPIPGPAEQPRSGLSTGQNSQSVVVTSPEVGVLSSNVRPHTVDDIFGYIGQGDDVPTDHESDSEGLSGLSSPGPSPQLPEAPSRALPPAPSSVPNA